MIDVENCVFLYKISELNESQLGFERQLSKWKISVFRL